MSEQRVAIVTGASRGIGAAAALELARRGHDVALVARDSAALQRVGESIEQLGRSALVVAGDLFDLDFAKQAVDRTIERFRRVDVLVNNAAWRELVSMRDITLESWEKTVRICLTAPAFLARWAAESMRTRRQGVIVNVSSMMSRQAAGLSPAYIACKGAIESLTYELAALYGEDGIRVLAVCPGAIDTEMSSDYRHESGESATDDLRRYSEDMIMLGRWGTADEIARLIAFAAGDDSSYLTATTIIADGGWHRQHLPRTLRALNDKEIAMSVWKWADWISPVAEAARVTIGEGQTPLVRSTRLGPSVGLENLWFKIEGANPSGSYKDRFAAVAISKMVADGKRLCLATSSGNTGSALAAYCARAGIECRIAIVEYAPVGKVQQMQAYGARLARIRGFGADPVITQQVFDFLGLQAKRLNAALEISAYRYSPVGMSGVETLAFEIAEQVNSPPDHIFCPAGGGGLTLAVARGMETLVAHGKFRERPRIECVQPSGNNTIAGPLRDRANAARPVTCTSSISGLQVASVIDGDAVIAACRRSGGTGHIVEDDDVYQVQRRLAREEGIFCEPAAAVSVAAALRAEEAGYLTRDANVICLLTGTAFKDSPSLARMAGEDCPVMGLADLDW